MYLLERNKEVIKTIYKDLNMNYVFESMIEGYTPCRFYVNNLQSPKIAVTFHNSVCYFGGESQNEQDYIDAIIFVKEKVDGIKSRGVEFASRVYYTSEKWEQLILNYFHEFDVKIINCMLFKYNPDSIARLDKSDVDKYKIEEILSNMDKLKNFKFVVDEVKGMWGSKEAFFKSGFGTCAIKDDEVHAWCTMEYKSDHACGLGIETIEKYQNIGLGTACCQAALNTLHSQGYTIFWESWKSNIPSIKVAQHNGFEELMAFNVIFFSL